jgi:hypothetical protein
MRRFHVHKTGATGPCFVLGLPAKLFLKHLEGSGAEGSGRQWSAERFLNLFFCLLSLQFFDECLKVFLSTFASVDRNFFERQLKKKCAAGDG